MLRSLHTNATSTSALLNQDGTVQPRTLYRPGMSMLLDGLGSSWQLECLTCGLWSDACRLDGWMDCWMASGDLSNWKWQKAWNPTKTTSHSLPWLIHICETKYKVRWQKSSCNWGSHSTPNQQPSQPKDKVHQVQTTVLSSTEAAISLAYAVPARWTRGKKSLSV